VPAVFLNQTYVVNNYRLARECLDDEARFPKATAGPLEFIRRYLTDNALITAKKGDEWALAHEILKKAFDQNKVRQWMFEGMNDITGQLALKWERYLYSPSHAIYILIIPRL
jgi:cytochrome P450